MAETDSFAVLSRGKSGAKRRIAFGARPGEQTFVRSVGVLLVALGVLGYFPGVRFGGNLFGILSADGTDNALHLLCGLAGIAAGFVPNRLVARRYCLACALLFSGVALATLAGMTPAGTKTTLGLDTVLHLALAVASLTAYWATTSRTAGDPKRGSAEGTVADS